MKLTEKDKEFLLTLKKLVEEKDLHIERVTKPYSRFLLKGNYGSHIENGFKVTRQGIRWRFQRLFSEIYVSAFETIIFIEKNFGTSLRDDAIKIANERYLVYLKNKNIFN